jgi:hypothetical protein
MKIDLEIGNLGKLILMPKCSKNGVEKNKISSKIKNKTKIQGVFYLWTPKFSPRSACLE